jgi:hypothetical protein
MSFRVRIKERGLPNGRVSLWVLSVVVKSLQVALRAEAFAISARQTSTRGRLAKLARESIGMSLVAIEEGSGVTVWESETNSLLDIPRQVFDDLVTESNRLPETQDQANICIQKSLLTLEAIFRKDSPVDFIEYINEDGKTGRVTADTVERIRSAIGEQIIQDEHEAPSLVTGRLLELNLSTRTFEIHGIQDVRTTVHFDESLMPIVFNAVDRFVAASIYLGDMGEKELISMETLDDVPESRFYEVRSVKQIISEQGIKPLGDFSHLALDEPDTVSAEEFNSFIRESRRGDA